MKRGEIWWFEEPDQKRRPYLVLTRDEAIPVLYEVLAAPVTRRVRGIPTEVALDDRDGVPEACCVSLDNITLILPALCTSRVALLSPARMREVCVALSAATGC